MAAESEGPESPPQGAARDLDAAVDNPSSPSATMSSPASAVTPSVDQANRISDLVTASLNQARNDFSTLQFSQPRPGQETSVQPPKTPQKQIINQHSAVLLIEEGTSFEYPSPVSQRTPSARDVQDDKILRRRLAIYQNVGARDEFVDQRLQASPQTPDHFTRRTTLHTTFLIKTVSTIQCDECKAKGKGEEIYKCTHCVKQICRSCVESLLKRERLVEEKSQEQKSQATTDDEEEPDTFKWNWQGLYRHEGFKQCYMAREEANVKGDFHIDIPVSQLGLPGNNVVTVYMVRDNDEDIGPHNAKRSRGQVDPSSSSDDGASPATPNGHRKPVKKRPRLEQADVSPSPTLTSASPTTGNEQQQQVTEPRVNRVLFPVAVTRPNPAPATQLSVSTRLAPAASREPSSAPAVQPASAPLPSSSASAQTTQPSIRTAPAPQYGPAPPTWGPAPPHYGPAPPSYGSTGLHYPQKPQEESQEVPQPRQQESYSRQINSSFLDPPRPPPNGELQYIQPRGYRARRSSARPSARPLQPVQTSSARQQQPAQTSSTRQQQPAQTSTTREQQPVQSSNARQQQSTQDFTAPQQQSTLMYVLLPPPGTFMMIPDSSGFLRPVTWEEYQRQASGSAPAVPRERRIPPPINTQLAQAHEHDQLNFPRINLPQSDVLGHRSAPALGQAGRRQSEAGQQSAVPPGRRESQAEQEFVVPPWRRESQAGQQSIVPPSRRLSRNGEEVVMPFTRRESEVRQQSDFLHRMNIRGTGEAVGRPMALLPYTNIQYPTAMPARSGIRLDLNGAQPYDQVVRPSLDRWSQAAQAGQINGPHRPETIVLSDDDEPDGRAGPGARGTVPANADQAVMQPSMQSAQNTLDNANVPSTSPQPIRPQNNEDPAVSPQLDNDVSGRFFSPLALRTQTQTQSSEDNSPLRSHLSAYYDDDDTESEEGVGNGDLEDPFTGPRTPDDVRAAVRADIQNRVAELLQTNPAIFDQFDGTHPDRAEDEIRIMQEDNLRRRQIRDALQAIPEARELGLPAGPLTDQDAAAETDAGHPPYRPGGLLFTPRDDAAGTVRAHSEEVLRAASILSSLRQGNLAQDSDTESVAEYDDNEIALPGSKEHPDNEDEAADIPSSPPVPEQPENAFLAAALVTPRRTRSGIEYTGLGRSDMGRSARSVGGKRN